VTPSSDRDPDAVVWKADEVPLRPPPGEDRILTVPNVVSVVRLCCIPLFVWLLFVAEDRATAAYLLAVLGATDWVDGYVARHFGQVSTLGKVLDPVADRMLLLVGVVSIAIDGSVPLGVAVLTLGREAFVAVVALVLAALGARRIDVSWFGKAGTFGQMVAYPLFLVSGDPIGWADTARTLAWVAVVPALVLSYVALAAYVPVAREALASRRAG
jgi:cardiolipin synthase